MGPIPHTDGLRMTHTTGLKHTKHTRPRHHHRPVATGRSRGLAPPARPRLAPVVGGTIRLCATRDHSRWRRRRKVRRSETRDDAMNLFSSFVRRDIPPTRARASGARERDIERARERERALRLTTRSRRRRQGEQGEQGGQVCEEGRQGKASQEAILRHLPQVGRATRVDDASGPRGCGDPARRRDGSREWRDRETDDANT